MYGLDHVQVANALERCHVRVWREREVKPVALKASIVEATMSDEWRRVVQSELGSRNADLVKEG